MTGTGVASHMSHVVRQSEGRLPAAVPAVTVAVPPALPIAEAASSPADDAEDSDERADDKTSAPVVDPVALFLHGCCADRHQQLGLQLCALFRAFTNGAEVLGKQQFRNFLRSCGFETSIKDEDWEARWKKEILRLQGDHSNPCVGKVQAHISAAGFAKWYAGFAKSYAHETKIKDEDDLSVRLSEYPHAWNMQEVRMFLTRLMS